MPDKYKLWFNDGRSLVLEVYEPINEVLKRHSNTVAYQRIHCDTCKQCCCDSFECITHGYIYWEDDIKEDVIKC